MDNQTYYNDLMARMEELFFYELSDCCGWKTEFIGIDFIQSIIRNCLKAITSAGIVKEASFAVAGEDILLWLRVKGCMHMGKEVRLKERGIKVYNCVIANMINDQLIEKLGYETCYVAEIDVDEKKKVCDLKVAIYADKGKIGAVSDWSEECKRIEANKEWEKIKA